MPFKFTPSSVANGHWRVVCYGDSLTAGYCRKGMLFEPYGRTLMKELETNGVPSEILISGHSGKTAAEMVAALNSSITDVVGLHGTGLARILDDAPSDLVIIMAGTNDMAEGTRPEIIMKDVAQLHAACHKRGVPTIALVPPPAPCAPMQRERDRTQLRELITEWAIGQMHVKAVVDSARWAGLDAGPGVWDFDGLHFCPSGSALLGHGIAAYVAKLLTKKQGVEDMSMSPVAIATPKMTVRAAVPATTAQATSPLVLSARQVSDRKPAKNLWSTVACHASGRQLARMPASSLGVLCA